MNFKVRKSAEYRNISLEEAFQSLQASPDGLAAPEAAKRLALFGPNEIAEKRLHPFREFLLRYWGPMPWLLELAIGLSFILKHYFEGIIIFALLTVNAFIGHSHSQSSRKALDLLKKKLAVRAKVLRDGIWREEEAKVIVPGDLFSIKIGDIVPADALIISGELSVDQSSLTESLCPQRLISQISSIQAPR